MFRTEKKKKPEEKEKKTGFSNGKCIMKKQETCHSQ